MEFQICTGKYETFGVTREKDILSFSLQAGEKATCNLLLYPKEAGKISKIPMERHKMYHTVYTVGIQGLDWKKYDYNYEIDGREITDPYARRITGREAWADKERRPEDNSTEGFVPEKIKKQREQKKRRKQNKIKSAFYFSEFDWKSDKNPAVKKEDMVIYKLHARGFTMGMKTESPDKGTFSMVERKLRYLKELGITTLLFLPVYEFEEFLQLDESKRKEQPENLINYWGYTTGNYFAPKASYLGEENNPDVLKRMIRKMHQMDMEFVAEFYFDDKINPHLIIEIMRYWKREYHVDGFRVIAASMVAELLAQDSMLSGCKLFYEGFTEELAKEQEGLGPKLFAYNDSFLYTMRRMLNHQGGDIYEFSCQMKRQQEHQGFVNFVAENNGFTLWDVFSYSRKHNEGNEEENRDGNDWNYSSNSGQEGISKKREINKLRERKVQNALAVTAFSQGIPMFWMGDECVNTQEGNNNAYCQDNEIGWKDWKNTKVSRNMTAYLQTLLKLRKEYPNIRNPKPYQMADYSNYGYPDLSYHTEGAWQIDFDRNRGFIGMFYCGAYVGREHVYIAYNFQNVPQKLALPREISWKVMLDTGREELKKEAVTGEVMAEAQSVMVLTGKEKKEKVEKKMKMSRIGINGFTLKWIAIITMLIDHIGFVLYPQYTVLRMIGRISFPIFCFLLVEGAVHTRSIRNYEIRLLIFALISEVPFDLAFYGGIEWVHQNVFFTLFIGVCALDVLMHERKGIYSVLAVVGAMLLAQELATDYGAAGIVFVLSFYWLYDKKIAKQLAFAMENFWCYQGLEVQYYAALATIPMLLYNGEQGPKMKYFFYLFYPAHLLILYLIIRL